VALPLFPLVLRVVAALQAANGALDPSVVLAAFHTAFNLLGVAILLPVAPRFAAVVSALVRERAPSLTRHLDASVAELPAVAAEAARLTVMAVAHTLVEEVRGAVDLPPRPVD